MPSYRIDETVVDPSKAWQSWSEGTRHNGQNNISLATGTQWDHETLYLSSKGRYYVVRTSDWQGTVATARWLTPTEAASWLLMNGRELPENLEEAAKKVIE